MKDETLATSIIELVVKSVNIPVTLKMRKGWNNECLNAPKLAKIAENSGIKMITVHGRTRCQMFKGNADWIFIRNVKENVKIPVVVNGDIKNIKDYKKALEQSGADGVMIGRGCYGNPWIFDYLTNSKLGKEKIIKQEEKKEIILEHLHNSLDHYGKEVGIKSFRKHLSWYSKSLTNSNEFRYKVNKSVDKIEVENLIRQFF